MTSSINSRTFGFLPTGERVKAWTLTGAGGLILEVMTYGGIVTKLLAPDREGRPADVVLGFNDLDSYIAGHPYFGAITGRVAGRITAASFKLEGKTYPLDVNDPPNHLHGGIEGFHKKIWAAAPSESPNGDISLRLTYRSPDGEEGFPGTVDVAVTYTVTADNVFKIETEASTDKATPFNLTHHSYFNLAGEASGSIDDHELQIYADKFIPTDEHMTLLGRLESVVGKGNDFRQSRRLGAAIPNLFRNHGDVYLIRRTEGDKSKLAPAARLAHPGSGRVINVSTTEMYFQLYTAKSPRWHPNRKIGHSLCPVCRRLPRMRRLFRRRQYSRARRYHHPSAPRTSAARNHHLRLFRRSHGLNFPLCRILK